jgi:hypothetical protein
MQVSEGDHIRNHSTSSTRSTAYTMDPEAKYLSPKPSTRHKARNPILNASENSHSSVAKYSTLVTMRSLPTMFSSASSVAPLLEPTSTEQSQAGPSASLAASGSSPLLLAFQKLRGTKSAGRSEQREFRCGSEALSNIKAKNLSMENMSRVQRETMLINNAGAQSTVSNRSPLRHTTRPLSMATMSAPASPPDQGPATCSASEAHKGLSAADTHLPIEEVPHRGGGGSSGALNLDWPLVPESPYHTSLDRLRENNSFFVDTASDYWDQSPSSVKVDGPDPVSDDQSSVHPLLRPQPESSDAPPIPTYDTAPEICSDSFNFSKTGFLDHNSVYKSYCQGRSTSSLESAQEIFSPDLAASTVQTGTMSPCHLSQPISPLRSDFGEGLLDSRDNYKSEVLSKNTNSDLEELQLQLQTPSVVSSITLCSTPHRSSLGFAGYSLSDEEHSSVLTLRNLPGSASKPPSGDPPFSQQGSKDLVHSWNDGSEHRINMTALEELVEDLGYLGEMIV